MRKAKIRVFTFTFIMLVVLVSFAHAAFVYGDIYQNNLQRLNKTVLKASGPFSYQVVTDKANYSLFLPDGEYNISVSAFDESGNLKLYAEEKVKVGSADQKLDLILKPVSDAGFAYAMLGLGGILVLAVAFVFILLKQAKQVPSLQKPDLKQTVSIPPNQSNQLDDDAKSVLKVLDSFEGRTTQKEIREALGFSDAKLSLILTELEQLGYVKKFKRGRANIVRKM